MNTDPKAKAIVERYEELKIERAPYERVWQDIRELVRPNTSDFNAVTAKGRERNLRIFDSTGPDANKDLASALHSYMTSPTERWFELEVDSDPALNTDPDVVEWCQAAADVIYGHYQNPQSGFSGAMQESYMDVGAFGMPIIYQHFDHSEQCLRFAAYPLADCFVDEGAHGFIDTVYRRLHYTVRQIKQQFPDAVLPKEIIDAGSRKFEIIHAVYPRSDSGGSLSARKRFASCWVLKDKSLLLRESGYDTMPYAIARWAKIAGEVYAMGPGHNALPDIRMLNQAAYTLIKGASKMVAPPLLLPNDGFLSPTDPSTSPDSILYYDPTVAEPKYLEFRGNIPIGMDLIEMYRESVRRAFFGEWSKMATKKERQTAYEIQELVEQQLRMMSPMLGRLNTELHGPIISRSFSLLSEAGYIPPHPPLLGDQQLRVSYVSSASRAQRGTKAIAMGRFLQELTPAAQIDPTIMDAIDLDSFASEMALARGIPRTILRTREEIASIRDGRAQEQQAAAIAGAAEPVSKAVLNLSQANAAGNIL